MHISEQKQKRQRFYVLKKHLRGKKLFIHLSAFLCFLCVFFVLFALFVLYVLFVLAKFFRKKKKTKKV